MHHLAAFWKVILWFSASGTSVLVMAPCQNGYFSYFSDEVAKFHRNIVTIPGTKLKIFEIEVWMYYVPLVCKFYGHFWLVFVYVYFLVFVQRLDKNIIRIWIRIENCMKGHVPVRIWINFSRNYRIFWQLYAVFFSAHLLLSVLWIRVQVPVPFWPWIRNGKIRIRDKHPGSRNTVHYPRYWERIETRHAYSFFLFFRKLLEQPRPDGDGEQHAARPQHAEHVRFFPKGIFSQELFEINTK